MKVKIDYGDRRSVSAHESLVKFKPSSKGGRKFVDITGRKFGMWTVIKLLGQKPNRHLVWACRCDCGKCFIKDGCDLKDTTKGGCKECRHKRMKKYAESGMWQRILASASKRGYEVSVTREYAFSLLNKQKHKCAVSGTPIELAVGKREFMRGGSTASLDRIDNTKGYTKSNIWWVHKDINRMKGTLPLHRFLELCSLVARRTSSIRKGI